MTSSVRVSIAECNHFLRAIGSLTRWHEWYDSKVPLFFVSYYYLCLVDSLPIKQVISRFAFVTGFACLYLAFGYLINDYSDRECDRRAGKHKLIASWRDSTILALLCLLGLAGTAIPLALISNHILAVMLTAIVYFFAVFYSMPPIRFKERGVWGLVVSAVAQRSLPVLVVFAIFDHYGCDTWLFFLLFGLIGVRWILVHQLIDLENDLKTGTSTFTTIAIYKRPGRLLWGAVFPLELISLITLWGYMATNTPSLWIVPPAYLIILIINWLLWRGFGAAYSFTSYGRLPLSDFYYTYWPVALACVLALRQPELWLLVAFTLLWEGTYLLDKIKTTVHLWRLHHGQTKQRQRPAA